MVPIIGKQFPWKYLSLFIMRTREGKIFIIDWIIIIIASNFSTSPQKYFTYNHCTTNNIPTHVEEVSVKMISISGSSVANTVSLHLCPAEHRVLVDIQWHPGVSQVRAAQWYSLKRRLNEGSRRFHNYWEGPYRDANKKWQGIVGLVSMHSVL